MNELIIPLPNGNTLRCGQGEDHKWGSYVRICSAKGVELIYWSSAEWEDPVSVMGAIFAYALKTPK